MSEIESKLERVRTSEGRARRRLSTPRACAGYDGGTAKRPERVSIGQMNKPSAWRRVGSDNDADPIYEREDGE